MEPVGPDISAYDARETYCRMLGHDVPFKYCRVMNAEMPCRRVVDCWSPQFEAASWLSAHFTPEQIGRITSPPPPKLNTILELIERAKGLRGEPS